MSYHLIWKAANPNVNTAIISASKKNLGMIMDTKQTRETIWENKRRIKKSVRSISYRCFLWNMLDQHLINGTQSDGARFVGFWRIFQEESHLRPEDGDGGDEDTSTNCNASDYWGRNS